MFSNVAVKLLNVSQTYQENRNVKTDEILEMACASEVTIWPVIRDEMSRDLHRPFQTKRLYRCKNQRVSLLLLLLL